MWRWVDAKLPVTNAVLTLIGDIAKLWKEHFMSMEEAEFEDSGEALPISLAEVSEVVKKLRVCMRFVLRC